jgi:phenolic acid decarboxylase
VCFQNDHLDAMRAYRDAGPHYPTLVIDEFAPVTFLDERGERDETVMNCAPADLPEGYAARRNSSVRTALAH